jgi:hypothetical protein
VKNRKRAEASPTAAVSFRQQQQRRYPVPLPEVVSIDVLGTLLDEDLIVRLRALDDDRNKVIDARGDSRPWEEEIAYVRREQQMRRTRRENHQEFVRKEQKTFDDLEASLPPGDFDNSAFVYAANGGRPRWN